MMSGLGTALGNLIMIFTGVLLIPAIAAFIVLLIKCIKSKGKEDCLRHLSLFRKSKQS